MLNKFAQRSVRENLIENVRKLSEDINVLKLRNAGGAAGSGSSDAAGVTYTPADNADWNSSADPGNVDSALDQLAARAKDLEAFTGLTSPVAYGFEVGMIMSWAGAIVDIPAGWQLCDGTNGTPDLRDKFIVGAGSTYSVDDTGGAANHDHDYSDVLEHTHPVNITDAGHNHTQNPHTHVQDPHQHGMAEGTTDGSGTFMDRSNAAAATTAVTDNATATNQNATATNNSATTGITATTSNPAGSVATGTTDTASNLPPYYALAFIMCMELGAGVAVHTHVGAQCFQGHGLGATIAAGATQYTPFGLWGLNATAYAPPISRSGNMKNLSIRTGSAQPGTGSLVVTLYVEGLASALVITIPAGSAAGLYSNTLSSVAVSAGDRIAIGIKNNASGASAIINGDAVELEYLLG